MKSAKKKAREDLLDEANHNIDRLHNLIKMKKKKQITYPPLLGYRGLVYGTLEKANLFADTLEESFKENADPYDDEHIEKSKEKSKPILTYACQIWGSAASSHISKLQIEQNKALRIMTNYPRYIARTYLHRDTGVEPINDRIRSLATTFHNQVITHPNSSISIQPFLITSGSRNHPISSTNLPSQF
ncbi:hypothetical protein TNCV_995651 [Trichonephila clavipes]|nr:hypothetical protein TNCV_995651 [Trichonephila clavipes]